MEDVNARGGFKICVYIFSNCFDARGAEHVIQSRFILTLIEHPDLCLVFAFYVNSLTLAGLPYHHIGYANQAYLDREDIGVLVDRVEKLPASNVFTRTHTRARARLVLLWFAGGAFIKITA